MEAARLLMADPGGTQHFLQKNPNYAQRLRGRMQQFPFLVRAMVLSAEEPSDIRAVLDGLLYQRGRSRATESLVAQALRETADRTHPERQAVRLFELSKDEFLYLSGAAQTHESVPVATTYRLFRGKRGLALTECSIKGVQPLGAGAEEIRTTDGVLLLAQVRAATDGPRTHHGSARSSTWVPSRGARASLRELDADKWGISETNYGVVIDTPRTADDALQETSPESPVKVTPTFKGQWHREIKAKDELMGL